MEYTDSQLTSRFGNFHVRVYQETRGKETVVLWSKDRPLVEPVLTRVHSECLTGDSFGSLHCDCRQQLIQSLRRIGQEGGLFIYLRQEGRGIGLFEKIKAYQLQLEGKDTFEANIALGHHPDSRSYEMVKTVLRDLGVHKIKLLTNNPSKVSDITSLGVIVTDIISLAVKPSKYNRKYLNAKKRKFSHFSSNSYQYQFFANDLEAVEGVGRFLSGQSKDPLLKICAAISLNSSDLNNEQKKHEITRLAQACYPSQIQPVLHFSFVDSQDYQSDLRRIKQDLSWVQQIQLNDFDPTHLPSIDWLFSEMQVDIPFSDENFELIKTKKIRDLIYKHRCLVVLDNSKGRGRSPDLKQLQSKIDTLLQYGVHRIGLAGGFGPDALHLYFYLKRFYRINFSIDSESGVRTEGKTDTDKVFVYLSQLLRNDRPKYEGIQQTSSFLSKHRRSQWETVQMEGLTFQIHPKVFHPGKFPSTAWFAKEIKALTHGASSFCEIGCGAGVIACLAAVENPSLKVIATDLNGDASANTLINAQSLGIEHRFSIKQGDVLDGIDAGEQFDVIFWALPFGFLDPGTPISLEEAQVFDPGYRAIRKLFQTAKRHLTDRGKIVLGFSSDLGHVDLLQSLAQEVGANLKTLAETFIQEDKVLKFEMLEVQFCN